MDKETETVKVRQDLDYHVLSMFLDLIGRMRVFKTDNTAHKLLHDLQLYIDRIIMPENCSDIVDSYVVVEEKIMRNS